MASLLNLFDSTVILLKQAMQATKNGELEPFFKKSNDENISGEYIKTKYIPLCNQSL